jgi:hypothetical protein
MFLASVGGSKSLPRNGFASTIPQIVGCRILSNVANGYTPVQFTGGNRAVAAS